MPADIINTDIYDNFPIFIVDSDSNLTAFPRKLTKAIRILTGESYLAFKKELSSINLDFSTLCQSVVLPMTLF